VGFGVLPTAVLDHVVAPAAGGLLAGAQYGHNLLAGGGALPAAHLHFHYLSLFELATVLATLVVAVPVARSADRARDAGDTGIVRALRAVQTGSVNDYATYLVVGLIVTVAALTLG
jgi:multicomponent Na+:H+ antiporter subunit D